MTVSMRPSATGITLVLTLVLSGCNHSSAPAEKAQFTRADYGVSLQYNPHLQRQDETPVQYFDTGSWQINDQVPGIRLITLLLPGSNEVTSGQWRLGVSREPAAVSYCLTLAEDSGPSRVNARIGGHSFKVFSQSDAGMNHFQSIESYRAVINATCYAIDLIVNGSNGEVYDPPRQPPFSRDSAMKRLRKISEGLSISER